MKKQKKSYTFNEFVEEFIQRNRKLQSLNKARLALERTPIVKVEIDESDIKNSTINAVYDKETTKRINELYEAVHKIRREICEKFNAEFGGIE